MVIVFYLITGILQFFKKWQTNKPFVILVPTFFIIGLGIVKEALAEIKRYKEDKRFNAELYDRVAPKGHESYSGGSGGLQTVPTMLQDLKVGDIIRIHDGQIVPADCILLKIENESNECFVKTVPLDGERNLKPKLPCRQLANDFDRMFDPKGNTNKAPLRVETMKPIKDLYTYHGKIVF